MASTKPSSPSSFCGAPSKPSSCWQETLDGLQDGVKFVDHDFPADHNSLYDPGFPIKDKDGKWQPSWGAVAITWARASETESLPNDVHDGQLRPSDINQGKLGDCYFLAALSVLAEGPHGRGRIERLLTTLESNAGGVYGARFYKRGFPVEVIVDDIFPCRTTKAGVLRPVFSQNKTRDLWPLILEKAYAKLHGSYQRIEVGAMGEALEDLTGAPTESLSAQRLYLDLLWARMKDAQARGFVMCAGTYGDVAALRAVGLHSDHSLSVLGVQEHGGSRFLRMRDPWGTNQWSGGWTGALRHALGWHKTDDGGVFVLELNDFARFFNRVAMLHIHEHWHYAALNLPPEHHIVQFTLPAAPAGAWESGGAAGTVEAWVSLKSEDKRAMGSGYSYPTLSFRIARAPDIAMDAAPSSSTTTTTTPWPLVLRSKKIKARDLHERVCLVPGTTYYVVPTARSSSAELGAPPPRLTVSVYSAQPCVLRGLEDLGVLKQLQRACIRDTLRGMPELARQHFEAIRRQALAKGKPVATPGLPPKAAGEAGLRKCRLILAAGVGPIEGVALAWENAAEARHRVVETLTLSVAMADLQTWQLDAAGRLRVLVGDPVRVRVDLRPGETWCVVCRPLRGSIKKFPSESPPGYEVQAWEGPSSGSLFAAVKRVVFR